MSRRAFFVATAVIAASALSGCTPAPEEGAGRLAPSLTALIDQALASDDLSQWDRAALEKASEDGQISQADYVEGMDLFDACLKSAGVEFTRTTLLNGVIELQPPPGHYSDAEILAQGKAQHECYDSINAATQEIFRMQQANPDLLADFPQAAVNCLKKAGVVDDQFTKEDFENASGSGAQPAEYPFDVMDPKVQTCLYSLGYSVKVDE
jgi:hypothetical protein